MSVDEWRKAMKDLLDEFLNGRMALDCYKMAQDALVRQGPQIDPPADPYE